MYAASYLNKIFAVVVKMNDTEYDSGFSEQKTGVFSPQKPPVCRQRRFGQARNLPAIESPKSRPPETCVYLATACERECTCSFS